MLLDEFRYAFHGLCFLVTTHSGQICLPFHGQEVFFLVIAFLACRHQVALGAFPAPGNRDDMIHGQLIGRCGTIAPMTASFGTATLPPLGSPNFPGFMALDAHALIV